MALVRYLVDDVDAAIVFYQVGSDSRSVSGWVPLSPSSRTVIARSGSAARKLAARPMPDGRRPEPGGWNRLVITVDDLEARVAELKQAGLAFRNEIVTGPGGKQIVLDDTAGNPVELFELPRGLWRNGVRRAVRWASRCKDAGSPDSRAIGATEDAERGDPARPRDTTTISPKAPSSTRVDVENADRLRSPGEGPR